MSSLPTPAPLTETPSGTSREVTWRWTLAITLGLVALLFSQRLLGPSNLTDNDQERPAAYVLDALRNGHWAVQYDWTGDIASKPPLYTWAVAGVSLAAGTVNRFTLYLPCALAMLGTALLVARAAETTSGPRAGLLAAVFLLANPLSAKLVALARTDPLFTFCVTLTAYLAHAAWQRSNAGTKPSGWKRAWLAATLATLTKGPLGAVLGFSGLLAFWAERRRGVRSPWVSTHWIGAGLLLLIGGGWFLLAYYAAGDALIAKMVRKELVGHAVNREGAPPGWGLILVPAYFLSRFAPWSLLAFWGCWQAIRRPDPQPGIRLLQRFAAAWLLTGIGVLGMASHQRGDLVAPLLPAGALLAAIPAARYVARWSTTRFLILTIGLPSLLAIGVHLQHLLHRRGVHNESHGLQLLATDFLRSGGNPDQLIHVDAPYALQFHLGTMHRAQTFEAAADSLRTHPSSAAAIKDRESLVRALGDRGASLQTLVAWPLPETTDRTEIVTLGPSPSNRAPR